MPIDDNAQQQYGYVTKPRMCNVVDEAARKYYTKTQVDQGLPQICEVSSYNHSLDLAITETSISPGEIVDFLSDFDNDPENNEARLSVTDADVTKHIQYLRNANPEKVAWQIEQEGEDLFLQGIKHKLQTDSIWIALNNRFEGYDPNPADKHYQLWKEYYRAVMSAYACMTEEVIEEQCANKIVGDGDAWYTDRIEKHRKLHKKSIGEFHSRLLLAEKNMLQQAQIGARATRTTARAAPHRARRAHAGHGATAKAGDDGDGDGEPPRPQSLRTPTPPLRLSLATHSLIAGGAQ
ncbi:hypothetical protein BBC27_09570 [Acidithiobacillus ferrivorans]|uniref:Uncharacterized protein n=1 Tax=Acidithiobacillus ferrivorans TaxID=160808 RepID=A0A1B9BZG0_9PROT|nr:hypothetical protein [Acidithiobacillus ferrivorans]OCB03088.1 hypothetical protein BBC27_09570 [Acidithiobacillus ferrivorans]